MYRIFTAVAFVSFTVHATIVSTQTANASNGSCAASGSSGCSCQPHICDTDGVEIFCNSGAEWDEENGCTIGGLGNGLSYETDEGADATVCGSSGPLVGGGCTSGAETPCKKIRTCGHDAFGKCGDVLETEGGHFKPCDSIN